MAQLPPKAPGMPQNWPSFSYQMMQMPSSVAQPPSWVDEFLDFSSSRRNSHRRSVSDPIAFIEAPNNFIDIEECRNAVNININAVSSATTTTTTHIGFDRLDDEQLRSMFADDDVAAAALNLPPSSTNSSNPSSPMSTDDQLNSDIDNPADQIKPISTNHHAAEQAHVQVQIKQQPKNEPDDAEEDGGGRSPADSTDPDKFSFQANSADVIVDPKRVKRILANRQSAQRSRVRKLQYISELERSVTTLQTEVSALSPRVAFLDHQRLILNVDNSALKQRIAALAQDKIFKDAHQEALRKEIERLRKLYQEQNHLKNMAGATVVDRATSSPPPPERQEQSTPASFNNNNITSTTAAAAADEDQ